MQNGSDNELLGDLGQLGRLLDQAVDLADRSGESLLAAQIAQALYLLDQRVAELRPLHPVGTTGGADRGHGVAGG